MSNEERLGDPGAIMKLYFWPGAYLGIHLLHFLSSTLNSASHGMNFVNYRNIRFSGHKWY